jgi:hypothetical protein
VHLPRPRRRPNPGRQGWIGLGATCVALAVQAGNVAAPPPGAEFRSAPSSTLVTRRDLAFVVARWQAEDIATTVLALRQPGAAPRPVARLQQSRQGAALQVTVQRLRPAPDTADAAGIEMAALEHLYGLVFRQQPLARYCLREGAGPCDFEQAGLSHAGVLRELAALRARAATQAAGVPGSPKPLPWCVIEMQGLASRPGDVDQVSARATGPIGPIDQLAVNFDRAPHSICSSRTDSDGLATCRLEDQHGDGSQHDHATAVVASFPGEVGADRVLLPTTAILPITAASTAPAFASPPALPFGLPSMGLPGRPLTAPAAPAAPAATKTPTAPEPPAATGR